MAQNTKVILQGQQICRSFPTEGGLLPVITDLDISVYEGELLVIIGRSGCGKTTLLRLLGGFDTPDHGQILLNGQPVQSPDKQIMMVFQSYDQLFPWFTLSQNISYAMKKSGIRTETDQVAHYLELVGLQDFADAYPHHLSGGMKQRGALARALALQPRVLLLDEPFSSLDALAREASQSLLQELHTRIGTTIVMVTHDIDEAIRLGQRICILDAQTKKLSLLDPEAGYNRIKLEEALRPSPQGTR